MPDALVHLPESERDEAANALAHFLASLGNPLVSALPAAEAVERGRALYHSLAEEAKSCTPAEQVQLTLTRLNCIACHQRDELGGVASNRSEYFTGREESLGEQGRIPPPLTGVGAKLKAAWLRDALPNASFIGLTPELPPPHLVGLPPICYDLKLP